MDGTLFRLADLEGEIVQSTLAFAAALTGTFLSKDFADSFFGDANRLQTLGNQGAQANPCFYLSTTNATDGHRRLGEVKSGAAFRTRHCHHVGKFHSSQGTLLSKVIVACDTDPE